MPKNILVIAPHCLDEILGCAGTVAKHITAGDTVNTVILFGDGQHQDAVRRSNAIAASKILGTSEPIFLGFAENRSDTIALLDVVSRLEKLLNEIKPEVVYINHGGNLNIDHQTTYKAGVTALRPAPGSPTKAIYSYETLSSTDWAPPNPGNSFQPTCFIDISLCMEQKDLALKQYIGDVRPSPHSRSLESLFAQTIVRGHSVGLKAAEAFVILRQIQD